MTLWRRYHILAQLLILTLVLGSCTSVVRYSNQKEVSKVQQTEKTNINRQRKKVVEAQTTTEIKKEEYDLGVDYLKEKLQDSYHEALLYAAEKWIGTPYKYGGNSEDGIDCSAFVMNVYGELGIELPRTAAQQYDFSSKVNKATRRVGDLVFFKNKGYVSHVGIYIGHNKMIHASSSNGVIISSLSENWYSEKYYATGRIY